VFLIKQLVLILALFPAILLALATGGAQAASGNDTYSLQPSPTATADNLFNGLNSGYVAIQGYVSEASDIRDRPGVLMPVAGARIYFVLNNVVVASTTSNPIGFYSVSVPGGNDYTIVTTANGFQSRIFQADFPESMTYDIGLTPIPFNGFVPYALYPVLETSPGREFDCVVIVQNFQVIDQMVTFTVVTPPGLMAWFPDGEAMMVRSGDSNEMVFRMKYTGTAYGPQVVKITVNGGAYFAEIPVVVIVKDLPFEEISFWSYSPEKIARPGDTVNFIINAENKYALDKDIRLDIEKPDGWTVTTGNGSELYIPDAKIGSSYLWAYIPGDTLPGNYTINLTLRSDGVRSNVLKLKVQVQGMPLYDAIIRGRNRTIEGFPKLDLKAGESFDLPVRIYNSWDFPLSVQASAEIGDNWQYYINGIPNGHVSIEPGKAQEFTIRSRVPDGTYGNFTARVYLESPGQDMTLLALIAVPAPSATAQNHDWEGLALTGATAITIALTLVASVIRRLRP
jgi:hypothetical protein